MTFIEPDADAAEEEPGIGLCYGDDGVCSSADAASAGAIRVSAFGQVTPFSSNAAFQVAYRDQTLFARS